MADVVGVTLVPQGRTDITKLTPLHHAVLGDHSETAKTLIELKCNIDAQDIVSSTPAA